MDKSGMHAYLHEYTDEELFYSQYNALHHDPEKLALFLSTINLNQIRKLKYVLPELKDQLNVHFANENWVWENENLDIVIHKHPRYMPDWDFVHEFYEVIFAYEGSFPLYLSEECVQMEQGHICILPPNTHHHISIQDESIAINIKIRKSTFITSFFPILSGNDTLAQFFQNTMYSVGYAEYILFRTGNDPILRDLVLQMLLESYHHQKFFAKIMNNYLSIMFLQLMRDYEHTLETSTTNPARLYKIENILTYIETNYRNVNLKMLSEKFHFSEQYISKFISENSGSTFKDIVTRIRLENASRLLKSSDLNINKIGEFVGYSSTEHFIRQFKKQFGVSPSAFRKKIENPKRKEDATSAEGPSSRN